MTTPWLPDDDDLADLYAAERRHPGPDPGAADRVKQAVLLSVAAGAIVGSGSAAATKAAVASTTAAATTAATTGAAAATSVGAISGAAALVKPAAVVVAAVIATAGGGVYVARSHVDGGEAAHVVVVEDAERPAPPAGLVVDTPLVAPVVAAPVVEARPSPKKPKPVDVAPVAPVAPVVVEVVAPVVETAAERTERLAAERGVIAEARAALSGGNTGGALIALEAHRSSFTRGELAEEREALTVMALARAGRLDEAKAKAKAFSSAWPRSLFQQAVDDAVRE